ncbi:hypothetical protein KR009_007687, partial [Drosophila setifemur]
DVSTFNVITEDRLPKEVIPLSYEIQIDPDIEAKTFNGNVEIHLKWVSDSKKVYFHAHLDLLIDHRKIKLTKINSSNMSENENVTILRGSRLPRKPIFVIYLKEIIHKGSECVLKIPFEGYIVETAEALFRGYYTNSSSLEGEAYLATNLKPNNARRVFPCFDEPGFKVPFTVSIARPKEYITGFNTPLNRTIQHPLLSGYLLDFFDKTPPMSTHTIGFVISKLEMRDEARIPDSQTIPTIHIWSNNISSDSLEDIQTKISNIYTTIQQFVNVSLPLATFDIYAIPDLPTVNCISNWGFLVVRESELFKKGIFTIAKELIYQWIGIWITPEWWSDANVNKALISFLASEIVIDIDGGEEFNGKYPMTILYSLYYELSKRYPYSRITGMKQESNSFHIELVIRMLKYAIGESTFKKGIQSFISDYKYKSFRSQDLWNILSKQAIEDKTINSDFSILDIAESWLNISRLPLVTINRDYKSETATVHQKLYLRERPHDVPDQDQMLWWIPITYIRQDNLNFSNYNSYVWLPKTKQIHISNMPDKNQFIIVNPEEIGPFPVNYDEPNWNMLSNYLNTEIGRENIPVHTRAKLLHDAWNIAYAGDLSFSVALDMTLFMKNERNHIVWNPVFTFLDQIGRRIDISSVHKKFELYTIALLAPLYEDLGSENENEDAWKTDLRKLTKTFLCRAGYLPCIKAAQSEFEIWLHSSNPDSENPVQREYICPVFRWGSMKEWIFGLERINQFSKLGLQSDRTFLLKMLAKCPSQPEKIHHLLELAILGSNSNFTESDKILIVNTLSTESVGYTTLLHFVSDNWDTLYQMFHNKTNTWDKLISSATGKISTDDGYEMVMALYTKHKDEFGSAKHIIERSLHNIKEEALWSRQNFPVIEKWLDCFLSKA